MSEYYWFAGEAKEIASKLSDYHGTYSTWSNNPICQAWARNSVSYYSTVLEPSNWETALSFEGEQGELVKMVIPQARSLIRQLVTLVSKQRLAFNAIAQSKGADVVQETRLGNALANQIVDNEKLDSKGEMLTEHALVFGMGFTYTKWVTDKGRPYAVGQDGSLVYDGDVEISVPTVWDVFFDYSVSDWDQLDWVEVKVMKSRWSLLAQYPNLEREIRQLPTLKTMRSMYAVNQKSPSEDDFVYVYEVYHKPTPAIPQGRMLMFGSPECVFHDGPNLYGGIPVEPMRPAPIIGMMFGHPALSDLLPAQEMLDHSFSAIATNQSAHAVQNVAIPRGAGVGVQEIAGMNFISYTPQNVPGGGKPEALQLTQSSPETFKFIDILLANMQQVSNINPALRGAPPPGVTSGVAIATLTTNSIEFLSSTQKAYAICLEKTMGHAINAYRKFAQVPHMVRMVGKNFQAFNKEFTGKDIDAVQGVKLSLQNPLSQTTSGRAEIAEKLMQSGLVKTPQEYFSIIEGAPLTQLYQSELSENDLICAENDALMDGEPVLTLATDDHPAHIRQHAALLNDPKIRFNNDKIQQILDHIDEHKQLAQTTDPFLTAMVRTGKMPEGGPPPAPGQGGPGAQPLPQGEAEALGAMPTNEQAQPAEDLLGRGLQ